MPQLKARGRQPSHKSRAKLVVQLIKTITKAMLTPMNILSAVLHHVHAFLSTLLLYILSLGPIPRHVGFVMDGNRRYARGRGMKAVQGHHDGMNSLRRTLEICLKLRIRAVTVFAFSIDNFSRSKEEVEALMKLAETGLMELCQKGDLLQEYGVRIRFVGSRHLLPQELQDAIVRMEKMTRRNKGGVLNVCAPYTSRDEITTSVRDTVQEVHDGQIRVSDIRSDDLFRNLKTSRHIQDVSDRRVVDLEGGKLGILVRTSDVKRLSDFMMWQASEDTQLHFVKTYWPDFGLTDMLPILLGWQQKVWLQALGW